MNNQKYNTNQKLQIANSELDYEIHDYLMKKYDKIELTREEVLTETQIKPSKIKSTSTKKNRWLLLDVIKVLNEEYYVQYPSNVKNKKDLIINYFNEKLRQVSF
jgi:hypothetical protein